MLALVGLPAWRYLTTSDQDERTVLAVIARRSSELLDAQQRNLAAHIVNNYVKVRRRG